jgi:AraC-like DNA-binding protein
VKTAAADFSMSLRSFQRGLNDLGGSDADCRNDLRMAISPTLLLENDMPITIIGQPVGYRGTSAFPRAFRAKNAEQSGRQQCAHPGYLSNPSVILKADKMLNK